MPEDWPAFRAFIERAGITTDIDWHPNHYVTVSVREFIDRASGVDRVLYTIRPQNRANGRGIKAVDLQPLDEQFDENAD